MSLPGSLSAWTSLAVSGTCVRVPVFTGHSLSINARFVPVTVHSAKRSDGNKAVRNVGPVLFV